MQTVNCPWCEKDHDVDNEMYNDGDCTEMFCDKCGHFFDRHDIVNISHKIEKSSYDNDETMEPCRNEYGSVINIIKGNELFVDPCVYCSGTCFRHMGETCECTQSDRHLRK